MPRRSGIAPCCANHKQQVGSPMDSTETACTASQDQQPVFTTPVYATPEDQQPVSNTPVHATSQGQQRVVPMPVHAMSQDQQLVPTMPFYATSQDQYPVFPMPVYATSQDQYPVPTMPVYSSSMPFYSTSMPFYATSHDQQIMPTLMDEQVVAGIQPTHSKFAPGDIVYVRHMSGDVEYRFCRHYTQSNGETTYFLEPAEDPMGVSVIAPERTVTRKDGDSATHNQLEGQFVKVNRSDGRKSYIGRVQRIILDQNPTGKDVLAVIDDGKRLRYERWADINLRLSQ
jgi:hypothetical protein